MPTHLKALARAPIYADEADLSQEAQAVLDEWRVVDRIRELTVAFEASAVMTSVSMEVYRREVSLAVVQSNLESPELNGLPSFESSSDYSPEAQEKKANIVVRAWQWIVKMFKGLIARIKALFSRSGSAKAQDKATNDKTKAQADQVFKALKAQGFKDPAPTVTLSAAQVQQLIDHTGKAAPVSNWLAHSTNTSRASVLLIKDLCLRTIDHIKKITPESVELGGRTPVDRMIKAMGTYTGKKTFPVNDNLRLILGQTVVKHRFTVTSEVDYVHVTQLTQLPTVDADEVYAYIKAAETFNDVIGEVFASFDTVVKHLQQLSDQLEDQLQAIEKQRAIPMEREREAVLQEAADVYKLASFAVLDLSKAAPKFLQLVFGVKRACDAYVHASIAAHHATR